MPRYAKMLFVSSPNDGGNTHATRLVGAQKQALLAEARGRPGSLNVLHQAIPGHEGRLHKRKSQCFYISFNRFLYILISWTIQIGWFMLIRGFPEMGVPTNDKWSISMGFFIINPPFWGTLSQENRIRTPQIQISHLAHKPATYNRDVLRLGPLICRKLTELLDGIDLPMVPGEQIFGWMISSIIYLCYESLCIVYVSLCIIIWNCNKETTKSSRAHKGHNISWLVSAMTVG